MEDGKCSKEFPKEFPNDTLPNKDGYPRYRRRDNGITMTIGKYEVDNRWIVPYNPYLLMKYNAHINVEICATVKSIKYLFKYIYKGHDCANIKLQRPVQEGAAQGTLEWDEIKAHLDARYVSAPEAAWRLFEFPLHDKSHAIIRLAVHLPNQQPVYFAEGNERQALEKATMKDTTLTACFKLNSKNPDAQKYFYHDIPEHFVFERNGTWKHRVQGENIIGRMYSVSPSDVERYHLRLLLLYTPGACSFDDLKTVDGHVCQTFMEAAKRRGLLRDDTEYEKCMSEAVIFQMPQQLRTLFCVILLYWNPTKPVDLWNSFKAHMAEDFMQQVDAETAEAMAFYAIDEKLKQQGRSCSDFGIPSLTSVPYSFESKVINKEEELRIGQEVYAMLSQDQRSIADAILASHGKQSTITTGSCFLIDGPGGTGKTYLYNTLYHLFMGQGVHVMTVAWTGIAASLLPEGRTAHSRFKLPVPILQTSTSSIRPNSKEAEEIRKTQIFIWDEAPMARCYALNAVDILLRDIMNIDAPFGGKVMILGGDFRQVLPVIRFANRSELIAPSLKSFNLWPYFKVMHLQQNMRTGPGEEEFSKWLIKLGNGELPSNEYDEIDLPRAFYLQSGLGQLKCDNFPNESGLHVWVKPVQSMVKVAVCSGLEKNDACLAYVKNRLAQLDKSKQEYHTDLQVQLNHLSNQANIIQQPLEKFIVENLLSLRKKIQHKIQLAYFEYKEEIIKHEYLKQNPNEAQIKLAEELCTAKQQEELSKCTSELLDKQLIHYNASYNFEHLPIARFPLFDSIGNADIQQQFYAQYRQIIEQTKTDMLTLYTQSAISQQMRYQNGYNDRMKKITEDQQLLPDEQKLTTKMIEIIVQRAHLIEERLKCVHDFKLEQFSCQS
ncbi:unnamed protein product [Rotaria sordida]|uniref:ATP-dependent DNA helicase n=1 Tax=Rotaria sordida TaxID=392033 RepID=A0A814U0R2_9BILA|nr:unnamed protein product [Rotaria sordida]CAF1420336.1 unnamed protein product [Rotaria sordida]